MSKNIPPHVAIGKITKAHGIYGEVVVHMFAEAESLFQDELLVAHENARETGTRLRVVKSRRHHGNLLLLFEGIKDRTAAERLRSHLLLIPRDTLPEPDEDEAYIIDLLGLEVYVQGSDAKPVSIGDLTNITAPAGQEIWTITTPKGEEILLPAVPEFVLDIDLDQERVLIDPPPGLLELYIK